jgi:acetyltransferase-like isoleucine patch superfamily enzyme
MPILDRLVSGLLGRRMDILVRQAVASELARRGSFLDQEALLYRHLVHGDTSRLHIDPTAVVNDALFNLSSGDITVGPHAFFGHHVAVLTGTHDITKFGRDRQTAIPKSGRDVVIGEGAWLASHVLVLGPCSIGPHAVVAAGSLVLRDVEAYTVVAGRPARLVRRIEPSGSSA